jgi:hypothetical protein
LLTLEGVNQIGPDVIVQAASELANLVEGFCASLSQLLILNKDNPQSQL